MHVVLAARREDRLKQVAEEATTHGVKALPIVCDVQKDADVNHAVEQTVEQFGRLDAVFANAGYGIFNAILDTPDEQVRDIYETNFFGTLRTIRAAIPHLKERGGHVLICTSACSEISLPMYGFYASTKSAQDGMAGALRAELHGTGIDVSTVHPIGTRTEFFEVAARIAGKPDVGLNTPSNLMHSAEYVGRCVVRCLRRPRPEVWPSVGVRFGVALTTAIPFLADWSLRRIVARRYKNSS